MKRAIMESESYRAGLVSAAVIGGVLLSACGSATSSQEAASRATHQSVSSSTAGTVATAPATTSPGSASSSMPPSPAAAAHWQRCGPAQLTATFMLLGAATGHVGAEIVLRNVSAAPCRLSGFPGLKMLDAHGAALPTTVGRGGSFLFPAIAPRIIGITPGQKASFDLEYADNPTGNPPPPYQQACPAAATLEITPPGDVTAVRAHVTMAPCNGDLTVSPVVAGTAPIRFS